MTNLPDETADAPKSKVNASFALGKLGVMLILLSGVFFFSMLSVPWWPFSSGQKIAIGTSLFVGMQVAWWVGAALVGPAAVNSLRGWFRRK